MGKIKLLPDNLINQIAAGEVVERPLSVVKELVENSIDAHSTDIVIELEKGGKKSITIKDNGIGMNEEDLFMCVERHATSKLQEKTGLSSIKTMGFRGEALAAISSVSKFSISSAKENGNGFNLQLASGKIVKESPVAIKKGTVIEVKDLFFNIPVRKKFLKSDEREFTLIRELIQKFAIINFDKNFTLIHNNKKIVNYTQEKSLENRILQIWKASKNDIASSKININNLGIETIIGSPFKNFSGTSCISVNNRIISDRKINAIIYKSFREIIGGEERGSYFLKITIPFEEVDVNVHPAKLEIRFKNQYEVLKTIEETIKATILKLRNISSSFEIPDKQIFNSFNNYSNNNFKNNNQLRIKDKISNFSFDKPKEITPEIKEFEQKEPQQIEFSQNEGFFKTEFANYKIIGTVLGLYIIVEMNNKVYFIDQHASHERITYTKLLKQINSHSSGLTQLYIEPETLTLAPTEHSILKNNLNIFNDAGFFIEIFDNDSALLRGVPALDLKTDWKTLIKKMINEIKEDGITTAFDEKFLGFIATTACHLAIRHNDFIEKQEIEALIRDINNSETLTCPHGRPFFFSISKQEIEKKIGRIK